MDLKLREITWVRLWTLLVWTLLMMIRRGISQLIEVIESRIFVREEPVERAREVRGTLLPPLDDELVWRQIWPVLQRRVNVSLLWRLRRVNRAWKARVGSSVEWAALEMVRVDAPGYLRFLAGRRKRRPSLQERVEVELRAFTILLTEDLERFRRQPEAEEARSERCNRDMYETSSESGEKKGNIRRRRQYEDSVNEWSDTSEEVRWSEEERVEACVSSAGSSMNVYYPRHVVRERERAWFCK